MEAKARSTKNLEMSPRRFLPLVLELFANRLTIPCSRTTFGNMSKSDQIRALREARAATIPPLKSIEPRGRGQHQRPTAKTAQIAKAKAAVAKLTSHPDCPVCNANREKARARMRRLRGAGE